jgi:hypothetical protein
MCPDGINGEEPIDSIPSIDPILSNSGIYEPDPAWWPPRVVWANQRGWLNVRDPWTGEWFQIPAREAPTGYVKHANTAKYGQS